MACAICTTLSTPGGTSTLSITWITPLLAATSALVTVAWLRTASVSFTPAVVLTASVVGVVPAKLYRVASVAPPAISAEASLRVGSTW